MKGHKTKKNNVTNTMIVAAIRAANPKDTFVRVTFFQSQRFFKLPNNANPNYFKLLKESEKNNTPVIVKRANEESDVILSVEKP
jgi:hypothetical protein